MPIATYVATELAILGVPFQLWMVIGGASFLAAILVGFIDGSGIQPAVIIVLAPLMAWRCRRAYLRDRHIAEVWRARYERFFGGAAIPLQPGWSQRSIVSVRDRISA